MISHVMKWPSVLAPSFQFDFLVGPAFGQELPQGRRAGCICARQKNIARAREARRERARGPSQTGAADENPTA